MGDLVVAAARSAECFDATCGYPGEGPALDDLRAQLATGEVNLGSADPDQHGSRGPWLLQRLLSEGGCSRSRRV